MLTRIAIVEDDAAVREGWCGLISASPGFSCVCACANAEEALIKLPGIEPDVVLMDINLPGMSGIECTVRLKQLLPQVQILMLTVYTDHERIFQALQAGAVGYLLKRTTLDELLKAVIDAQTGGAPMTSEIARKLVESFRKPIPSSPPALNLSQREAQVLDLLSHGLTNKEIGERLHISYDTVRTHLKHVFDKLHVRSRSGAVSKFLRSAGP